uniref:Antimicrobial peptide 4 n=1 Tax=Xenopus tropicalis TaxID=8364 RepID=XT4_XENTR|nr:RecName: Full=Antimicrobial peptide 4; AltName: Full=XT-4 [Xenopus tropicalis]
GVFLDALKKFAKGGMNAVLNPK